MPCGSPQFVRYDQSSLNDRKAFMQTLINLFGRRRFNYIDVCGVSLSIGLWNGRAYIAAIVTFFLLFLASATLEHFAE